MSQALNTAMTGMTAGQQQISVVADNIANINTVGFKESSITFQDIWYQTKTTGTAPTGSRGGVNSFQTGIGTVASTITKNWEPSTMNTTGKTSDMTLMGKGFFTVVSPRGEVFYTRAGNFTLDPNGNLVTSNGYKVMGIDSDLSLTNSGIPVVIPQALEAEAYAQPQASFGAKLAKELNDAQISPGTFYISPVVGGVVVPEIAINVTDNMTVNALAADITTQLAAAGYNITCDVGDGTLSFNIDGATGGTTPESISFRSGTSNFVQEAQLSTATNQGGVYSSKVMDYKVEIEPVNNLKDAISLSSWSVSETGVIEATYSNGDKITVANHPTDNSKIFKYTTSTGVEIFGPEDCRANPLVLVPENLQMQFATVTNPEGMVGVGGNLYSVGPNAGTVFYSAAGGNGVGALKTGGVESSNVDMARQFSNMIMAQRAIEANSRVFDTANSILQTLVYLGRG